MRGPEACNIDRVPMGVCILYLFKLVGEVGGREETRERDPFYTPPSLGLEFVVGPPAHGIRSPNNRVTSIDIEQP